MPNTRSRHKKKRSDGSSKAELKSYFSAWDPAELRAVMLLQCRTYNTALELVLVHAIEISGAAAAAVHIPDNSDACFQISRCRGISREVLQNFKGRVKNNGAVGRAFQNNRQVAIEDVDADLFYAPFREAAHEAGISGIIATPVHNTDGAATAVLSVFYTGPHKLASVRRQLERYVHSAGAALELFSSKSPRRSHGNRKRQGAKRRASTQAGRG